MNAVIPQGNEPENDELVIEIHEIVVRPEIQSSTECRIYRVPYHIRKWNSEAYTPQVISVGPFHHENRRLKDMEEVKESYFSCFVRRCCLILGDLVRKVRQLEERIRGCYDGTIDFRGDWFVKMILVDACFILELLFRHNDSSLTSTSPTDPMAVEPRAAAIIHDLILLENQLPFFVIVELYDLASPSLPNIPSLLELCFDYFGQFNICCIEPHPDVNIKHFTDLLRTFQIPPLAERPGRGYGMDSHLCTPTQLHQAGVELRPGAMGGRLNVKFENEVLEIPTTVLDDWEEVVARNIIALEQTCYIKDGYFTDYFIFMDFFIRTREDVDLLSDKGIFTNLLSDGNAAVSMFKNLTKGISRRNVNNVYGGLCRSLNHYYQERWHRCKAELRRNFFSSPSASVSFTYGICVITALTLIQTVCSIMQVTGSGKG